MRRLSPREQRLSAVLLLLVMLALAWLAAIHPLAQGFADRAERRRELQFAYLRDERAIGQLPSLGRAAATQRRSAFRFRLSASDEAGAAAALRDRLAHAVSAAGGQLREIEDIAPASGMVRARMHIGGTNRQLAALLDRLANGTPVLIVDAMRIDAKEEAQPTASGLLDISLDVSAAFSASSSR